MDVGVRERPDTLDQRIGIAAKLTANSGVSYERNEAAYALPAWVRFLYRPVAATKTHASVLPATAGLRGQPEVGDISIDVRV